MPGDFGGAVSVSDFPWGVRIAERAGTKWARVAMACRLAAR